MVQSLNRKLAPTRSPCAPVWCERLFAISYSLLSGRWETRKMFRTRPRWKCYRRSNGIAGRRLQIAVGELPPHFVDGSRRKGHDVAERQSLVAVIQLGGGAGCDQAPAPREFLASTS